MSCKLSRIRALLTMCAAVFLFALGGCASTGNPRDPLEPLNRGIYKFNDVADHLIVRPAAEVYRGVIPDVVRTGVSNFFSNINDVIVALNNLLQGKVTQAFSDVGRIAVNSTVGMLGILDIATEIGLEKHNEDFGQTLGRWGFGAGPYLVLPFLGPSSLRDGIGLLGDWKSDPLTYVDPTRTRNQLYGLYFLSRRTELLDTSDILEVAALDPYEFVRDAYLQRRRNLVYDGNAPDEDDVEIKAKPGQDKSGSTPAPRLAARARASDADPVVTSLESAPAPASKAEEAAAASVPTTAEIEARGELPQAEMPAAQPRSEAVPESAGKRVVRVWLPSSR